MLNNTQLIDIDINKFHPESFWWIPKRTGCRHRFFFSSFFPFKILSRAVSIKIICHLSIFGALYFAFDRHKKSITSPFYCHMMIIALESLSPTIIAVKLICLLHATISIQTPSMFAHFYISLTVNCI